MVMEESIYDCQEGIGGLEAAAILISKPSVLPAVHLGLCLHCPEPIHLSITEDFNKIMASLVAEMVKNLPAMQESWVGKIPWRRERLLTPGFWPGEFHGLYSAWGGKESDTTERVSLSLAYNIYTLYIYNITIHMPRLCIKKQRHHFADKDLYSQSYHFSNSQQQM